MSSNLPARTKYALVAQLVGGIPLKPEDVGVRISPGVPNIAKWRNVYAMVSEAIAERRESPSLSLATK